MSESGDAEKSKADYIEKRARMVIAIAKHRGWQLIDEEGYQSWAHPDVNNNRPEQVMFLQGELPLNSDADPILPDYLRDMNAWQNIEITMSMEQWTEYIYYLCQETQCDDLAYLRGKNYYGAEDVKELMHCLPVNKANAYIKAFDIEI